MLIFTLYAFRFVHWSDPDSAAAPSRIPTVLSAPLGWNGTDKLRSAWTGAETTSPLVRTIRHRASPWLQTGPKPRTGMSKRRQWMTQSARQMTNPKRWWWRCRRRKRTYPKGKRGLGNLTFFCLVWDTQSDSEMSGDFLIYVARTAEVIRIFFGHFPHN